MSLNNYDDIEFKDKVRVWTLEVDEEIMKENSLIVYDYFITIVRVREVDIIIFGRSMGKLKIFTYDFLGDVKKGQNLT